MRKLMAIFAHPDDEGAIGGTLAHYASQGVEVTLVCATRGEVGEISDPALATPETLPQVRTTELEAACEILGIHNLRFLDYRDSGMENTPPNEDPRALIQADPEEAIGRIVALIRELKPDVVVTFEPYGWYGHPDHRAVYRLATAAYEKASQADAYPDLGEPWQPQRLFYAVLLASNFKKMIDYLKAQGLAEEMEALEPKDFQYETDAQVTHKLDTTAWFETNQRAMLAHQTQFGEDNFFRKIPEDAARQMWGYEHFILVQPTPDDDLRSKNATDLFEGT